MRTTAANHKKHEELLREQVHENESNLKHIKRLNLKITNLQNEVDKQNNRNENLRKELHEMEKTVKDLNVELQR